MIFKFDSYLAYLSEKVGRQGTRTGQKSLLAKALNCQQPYITKVLKGEADISLEQAHSAAEFFNMTEAETDYFLVLVNIARAGTRELKDHYLKRAHELREKMVAVEEHLQLKENLSLEQQQVYYSSWHFMAAHMAVSLKKCDSIEDVCRLLDVERELGANIVEFLLITGLVRVEKNKLVLGPTHTHLSKESPEILKNHTNWRLKALDTVTNRKPENFHYSVVVSLSEKDAKLLKAKMVEWVAQFLKIIEPSQEETIFCHTLDFFRVVKK